MNEMLGLDQCECRGSRCTTDVKQVGNYYLCQHCDEGGYFPTLEPLSADDMYAVATIRRPCDMYKLEQSHTMLYKECKFSVQKCTDDGSTIPFLLDPDNMDGIANGVALWKVPTATAYKVTIEPIVGDRMFPFDFRMQIGSRPTSYRPMYRWSKCTVDGFTEGGNDSFVFTSFPKDDQEGKDATGDYCEGNIINITIIQYKRIVSHAAEPAKLYSDAFPTYRSFGKGSAKSCTTPTRSIITKSIIGDTVTNARIGDTIISGGTTTVGSRHVAKHAYSTTSDTFNEIKRFTVKLQLGCIQIDIQKIMGNSQADIRRILDTEEQIKRLQSTSAKLLKKLNPLIASTLMEQLADGVASQKEYIVQLE